MCLLVRHCLLKVLNAADVAGWWLPYVLRVCIYCDLASLHCSVNQGVRCLPHLLGFLAALISMRFITPAAMASVMRNCSTCVDLVSLLMLRSSMIWLNAV